ncbi:MAG: wax ester/triacylglycerol synthase family O-acyltransferase [Solirubrobacteraceae bacterium]
MSVANERLTALDATFLELEEADEGATMHIGGLMLFDPLPAGGIPTLEALTSTIAGRLAQLPRYSQRLSSTRAKGLSWPCWCPDERFDVRNHIRHESLPVPGDEQELCDWAGEFFSHRLDRTRPLWEMVLLEGLAEGRWAVASKTHHAMVDGVGSVGIVQLLFDGDPNGLAEPEPVLDGPDAPWEAAPPSEPGLVSDAVDAVGRVAGSTLHAALHPREAIVRSRALLEVLVSSEISGSPHTTLNVPIGATRRYGVVQAKLSDLKAAGHVLGGSVNDMLLAACTAGVRELMLSRGERPPEAGVRAMVPMNIRRAGERLAMGNRVSSLFVDLPVATGDTAERFDVVTGRTARLKSSRAGLGAETMLDVAGQAPPVLHSLIARSLYATRLFNITITNVPGPRVPLYSMGAPLSKVYPMVPLAAEHAVGIAIFSYMDEVAIGITADRDSCPDLDVMLEAIHAELTGLARLAGSACS